MRDELASFAAVNQAWPVLVKASLVWALVIVLALVFRKRSPAFSRRLWFASMVAALGLAAASLMLPAWLPDLDGERLRSLSLLIWEPEYLAVGDATPITYAPVVAHSPRWMGWAAGLWSIASLGVLAALAMMSVRRRARMGMLRERGRVVHSAGASERVVDAVAWAAVCLYALHPMAWLALWQLRRQGERESREATTMGSIERVAALVLGAMLVVAAALLGSMRVDPSIVREMPAELQVYERPPLFDPAVEGDAEDDYAEAVLIAQAEIATLAEEQEKWNRWEHHPTIEGWAAEPRYLRDLARSEAASKVVELVERGARRELGRGPWHYQRWSPDLILDDKDFHGLRDLHQLLDMVALDHWHRGDRLEACRIWLVMARVSQDLERGRPIVGLMISGYYELQSLKRLVDALGRDEMDDAERRSLLPPVLALIEGEIQLGDALWAEALWRVQYAPEVAALEETRELRKQLLAMEPQPNRETRRRLLESHRPFEQSSRVPAVLLERVQQVEAMRESLRLAVQAP